MTSLTRPVPRLALNRTEVAIALGLSADSIDRMVDEGVLPPPRRWHKRKLWLVAEIEAFLTELPADALDVDQESAGPQEDWTAQA